MSIKLEMKVARLITTFLDCGLIEKILDWAASHKWFSKIVDRMAVRLFGLFMGYDDWYRFGAETDPE
jgi:hypothetical protein